MAIQVNGTQVIGNSRELTNIASVDATTAAAIGAAGVGGGVWSLESTTTISSTVTTISGIVIPSSGNMVMMILEDMKYAGVGYYNNFFRLSTNGGSSYYSGNTDYFRFDRSERDSMKYRESAQSTGDDYHNYSAILLQGLPNDQKMIASHMWGIQNRQTNTLTPYNYFEQTSFHYASLYSFEATKDRPNRLQFSANVADTYVAGKIHMYSYSA
jgi:hypothetical protein